MRAESSLRLVDLLAELGRDYRHFQKEHERERPGSATRRVLGVKMQRVAERFHRLLHYWVADEALLEAWTRYLHEGGSAPDEPRISVPPAFKGISQAGSEIEIRPTDDGAYDLVIDGSVESHESVPWNTDPDMIEPIRIGEHT